MAKNLTPSASKNQPGEDFEKTVARIQQQIDPNATVTHNEKLIDRIGNKRQYDVVIRGQFAGRPMIGVIECKDHKHRIGPEVVESFAKKTENLGTNLRILISRKGFTDQALKLARFENIGCYSLLPGDKNQAGFQIGEMWYGIIKDWPRLQLTVHFDAPEAPIKHFKTDSILWEGKEVYQFFRKELLTNYKHIDMPGPFSFSRFFKKTISMSIEGKNYPVKGISCHSERVIIKKKKWINWSGDAFIDWHTLTNDNRVQINIPANTSITSSFFESDLNLWEDLEGEIPEFQEDTTLMRLIYIRESGWDTSEDCKVPDLSNL